MKIKIGDHVRVTTGKNKGKDGKVQQVFPPSQRLIVEGVNKTIKHLRKQRGGQRGQKIEYFAPIHLSNVRLISPKSGVEGRVGFKKIHTEGLVKKVRQICKKGTREDIE
ncbi:TPA: 50S ribosomal protein L24 [Candidatus Uhrbacteria bacterium]|uniref:Large ribosomal subunit protein uL24 n=2 Tax=Candidatus Uhriibacteriota TaxID=1752732 RepID=A0A0G1Q882_9BACT|nr:MAG: 50S ribosomal protein L24 [Candidatus Uhrbacteria bacterium GW2011_GWF2_46_218]KKU41194.1 MAG: 50S ribosomal protein L24 [Candidatus Uhrbacteria bacterium GW2011_GWE2_46_68]HBK34041.1 50S ribosomal protein L24 [Candidatus Uhrbacteria bacterium]HCB18881.1 50S ribosomal protein L24 [Candidatus Uhrbacteria bacterium]